MHRIRLITISALLFLSASAALSQTGPVWVACYGEAAVHNISAEEAQSLARQRARLDAIEKACGINLQAETLVRDFIMAGDFIHTISYGFITEEKDHVWSTEVLDQPGVSGPPVILYKLEMMAKVQPVSGKPDPSFKVDLALNRTSYDTGDEVIFTVRATQDCYITIINLAADDSVYVLFPNRFYTNNFALANTSFVFPDESARRANFHIRVSTLPGHQSNTELVKVVATKSRIDLLFDLPVVQGFGRMGTPRMAVQKLAQWLSEIPISQRAEATVIYTVSAKE